VYIGDLCFVLFNFSFFMLDSWQVDASHCLFPQFRVNRNPSSVVSGNTMHSIHAEPMALKLYGEEGIKYLALSLLIIYRLTN